MIKIFLILALFLTGCASLKPKEEVLITLDKTLPPEIQTKFEVKEIPPALEEQPVTTSLPKRPKLTESKVTSSKQKSKEIVPIKESFRSYPTQFIPGESFKLSVKYLGMHAGNLEVKVLPDKFLNNHQVYHLKTNIYSAAFFSSLFKVNLLVESFVDKKSFFSRRFQLSGDEGKVKKQNLELYDPEKLSIFEWKKEEKDGVVNEEKKESLGLVLYAQDLLSAFFYIRTLNFDTDPIQKIDVVNGDKVKKAELFLIKKDKTFFLGKTYDSWIVGLNLNKEDSKTQEITIIKDLGLITKIKADIKWGSFSVELYEYTQP